MMDIKDTCKTITSALVLKLCLYCFIPDVLSDGLVKQGAGNISLAISSVVGPPINVRLCGHLIEDIIYWAPSPPPTTVSVSVLTYAGGLRVGVEGDGGLNVAAKTITDTFEEVFRNFQV